VYPSTLGWRVIKKKKREVIKNEKTSEGVEAWRRMRSVGKCDSLSTRRETFSEFENLCQDVTCNQSI